MTEHESEPRPRIAVFRPNDERIDDAVALLESLGVTAVADPLLAVQPTDAAPRTDAAFVVLTSKTGVELAAERGWEPAPDTMVCAIGEATAAALRDHGYRVDVIPEEYSSTGMVSALRDRVAGDRVEVARSDHGSPVLLDGLVDAGADVHETVLYRLVRPAASGHSTELAAAGELAGALFTSSLTVEHFLEAATERGLHGAALAGLEAAVVGCIGEPTRETAEAAGIAVDVVPTEADFDALARAVVERIEGR